MYVYRLRKDELFHKEIGSYEAYGIDVYNENDELIRSVLDVSFEEELLSRLISDCNELELELVHLDDVIEDFLK